MFSIHNLISGRKIDEMLYVLFFSYEVFEMQPVFGIHGTSQFGQDTILVLSDHTWPVAAVSAQLEGINE